MPNTPNPFTKIPPLAVRILREEEFRTACRDYDTRAGDAFDFHMDDEFHYGDNVMLPCISLYHLSALNRRSMAHEQEELARDPAHMVDPGFALLQEIIDQARAAEFTHIGEAQ